MKNSGDIHGVHALAAAALKGEQTPKRPKGSLASASESIDIPAEFGGYATCWRRSDYWTKSGIWLRVHP